MEISIPWPPLIASNLVHALFHQRINVVIQTARIVFRSSKSCHGISHDLHGLGLGKTRVNPRRLISTRRGVQ